MKKFLKFVLCTSFVLFMCWAVASFFDLTANNSVPNPVYATWNLFML